MMMMMTTMMMMMMMVGLQLHSVQAAMSWRVGGNALMSI
jgi:hypothetical protein